MFKNVFVSQTQAHQLDSTNLVWNESSASVVLLDLGGEMEQSEISQNYFVMNFVRISVSVLFHFRD